MYDVNCYRSYVEMSADVVIIIVVVLIQLNYFHGFSVSGPVAL